jgi:hypothetical protein
MLARLEESLDFTHFVNHGFTRKFIHQMRVESNFSGPLSFIRDRVANASKTLELHSAVISADRADAAAHENNQIQRRVYVWAIIAAILTLLSLGTPFVQSLGR